MSGDLTKAFEWRPPCENIYGNPDDYFGEGAALALKRAKAEIESEILAAPESKYEAGLQRASFIIYRLLESRP